MKKKLKTPKFKKEDQERNFWSKIDLSDYFASDDFDSASFPNLKPSSQPISLRIPQHLLLRIKEKANERGVPYQSLIKEFIAEGVLKKS